MKCLTASLALGLLLTALPTAETQAQRRKPTPKPKAIPQKLVAMPVYTTTDYHTDSTWMLADGVAFELTMDLQFPACDACPTYHTLREWYKAHYTRLANAPQYAAAQLARFALDTQPAPQATPADTASLVPKKKKRKSRKERKAEAERLAAMTVTNKTPRHSLDLDLERLFENSYITTYRLSVLHYAPHASGQEQQHYITINKATGQALQWHELYAAKQQRKFVSVLATSLQRHFQTSDWKNLTPLLNNPALRPSTLPLPKATPIIVAGSLYAVYASGEITPTSNEAPTLIIDAQWLKGALTPAASLYFK